MSQKDTISTSLLENPKKIVISLILVLLSITLIYQTRPFLDDSQFSLIAIPAYAIFPGVVTLYASILAIKLHKQKNFESKGYAMFAVAAAFWFIAEQIWQLYDHVWEGEPFPSEADIFYVASYPLITAFLFLSLKPVIKKVPRNVWLFAIGLAFSLLVPSVLAAYDDMFEEDAFPTIIALTYPVLSAIVLVPAIVGILFLAKQGASLSWMLILFGFIIYGVSDIFFLFAELDGAYYDGHPVDLMYLYSYTLIIFAFHVRLKIANLPTSENRTIFFTESIKFETISKFGIPLTVAIVSMIILISIVHSIFIETDDQTSTQNIMLGVVAMLAVFAAIVITINKNLSRLVKMRTNELVEQRDNLENLVEEKTHEILKSERLSAIGELSGRLAHDLRNPLSVMKMSIDLIKQSPADSKISDANVTKRIDLIEKSIDRISHQVDDVLGYVRNSPLNLVNVSLVELVQSSLDKVNIPKDVQVKISKKDVHIDCDAVKLDAVFINLIINSIQAMHEGGKIDIVISDQDNVAILKFVDSGDGIPDENIEKIFEPLFTTKQKGTGLGLASCKNIIEQHQGEISVSNNPTTFTIILPKILSVQNIKLQSK
ncbi:two-component sensor histidine kinase [Nitrosopumilus cobalaminigenes]|uniref:Two-component sensor histidine kinase n=1 Tax=Nitrosopumilus cobalaminigenes TaxID=1470066 RepID=A0A7D5QZ38_9ARCH|nr:HAMP domain-containing sensor histidine kinase [Nitrosopumilus cobalaminigenes]QLH02238.1 two-component sensor histidine kinase [Nitrosopumilus cobalaminigenes]